MLATSPRPDNLGCGQVPEFCCIRGAARWTFGESSLLRIVDFTINVLRSKLTSCRLYDKCVTIKTYFRLYDKCVTIKTYFRLYDKCVTIKTYYRLYDKCVTTLRLYLVYNILLHGKCPLGSAVMSTYMPIKGICLSTCRSASLTSLTRVARSPNHSCGSRSSRLSVKKMTEMQKIVSRRVVRGWRSNFVSGQTDGFRRFCRKQFLI